MSQSRLRGAEGAWRSRGGRHWKSLSLSPPHRYRFLKRVNPELKPRSSSSRFPPHPTPRDAASPPQTGPPSPTPPRTSAGCGEKLMLWQILGGHQAFNPRGAAGEARGFRLFSPAHPLWAEKV